MRILMVTNLYTPKVGGITESILRFRGHLESSGHQVLVIAPEFEDQPENEPGVVRVPAIKDFQGTNLSVSLPSTVGLNESVRAFDPEIVHSHHPFLLGNAAVQIARSFRAPLVYTHHTMYEHYTHYVPLASDLVGPFLTALSIRYANNADHVIAPSQSVLDILGHRGLHTPGTVIPTGIDVARYARGNGTAMRERLGLPPEAFVVGHLGRLCEEKGLHLATRAAIAFLRAREDARLLVVGDGPLREDMQAALADAGLAGRAVFPGILRGQDTIDAYHAMNVFLFTSKSETQGMVLTEAMAAGVPVVALDAPGARDTVEEGRSGRLVTEETPDALATALADVTSHHDKFARGALARSQNFDMETCAARLAGLYRDLLDHHGHEDPAGELLLAFEQLGAELNMAGETLASIAGALFRHR